jgi:RNA polymerase sigma factor (sigma-70 family)
MTVLPQSGYYATQEADRVQEYSLLVQSQSSNTRLANRAKVELIDRNMRFLSKQVWSWVQGNPAIDFKETMFNARVAFLDAINRFDITKGVSIRAFAFFYLKKLRRETFYVKEQPIEITEELGGYENMSDPDFSNFSLRGSLCQAFDAVLTLTEQQVLQAHYFEGNSQKTVALVRCISEARVSTIIKIALPKLRKYLQARGINPGFLQLN